MKRIIAVVLLLALLLVFAGCGSTQHVPVPGDPDYEGDTSEEVREEGNDAEDFSWFWEEPDTETEYESASETEFGFESAFFGYGADFIQAFDSDISINVIVEHTGFHEFATYNYGESSYLYHAVEGYAGYRDFDIYVGTLEDYAAEYGLSGLTKENFFDRMREVLLEEYERYAEADTWRAEIIDKERFIGEEQFPAYEAVGYYEEDGSITVQTREQVMFSKHGEYIIMMAYKDTDSKSHMTGETKEEILGNSPLDEVIDLCFYPVY